METIWASTVLLLTLVNAGMISASTMMAAPVEATGGDGGGRIGRTNREQSIRGGVVVTHLGRTV